MKQLVLEVVVKNLLLNSAHDAMPYYNYCKANVITPFIDPNWKCGRPPVYKDDISISSDDVPLCPKGFPMKLAAVEAKKVGLNIAIRKSPARAVTPIVLMQNLVLTLNMVELFTL